MFFGYARDSATDQNLNTQLEDLLVYTQQQLTGYFAKSAASCSLNFSLAAFCRWLPSGVGYGAAV